MSKTESETIRIDGQDTPLRDTPKTTTLLEFLRKHGYVGTKEGCGDGDCGACTVAMVGPDTEGQAQYQAVNSCLIPVASCVERDIVTVEGIGSGKLHPVQQAMIDTAGSQCGYCTPGFIMSMFAAYYSDALNDVAIEGNLCRCTGYVPIRKAMGLLAKPHLEDEFLKRLREGQGLKVESRKSMGEDVLYIHPTRLDGVFDALEAHPEAVLLAGGTDLGLEFSHKTRDFPVLVSLESVKELQVLGIGDAEVFIGAGVPLSHIETKLRGIFPALDEMLHWFAARQIRNRATLGGNLGTASPIGDLPPVLLALDAVVTVASRNGTRQIPIAEFFKGYRQADVQTAEVIEAVSIPHKKMEDSDQRLSHSYKVGKRGTDDISIVAAAFTVDLDAENRIMQARLAYGGVAATPLRAFEVETSLAGKPWTLDTVQAAKQQLKTSFTPLTDLRGSAEYRNLLIGNLFEKFFYDMSAEVLT